MVMYPSSKALRPLVQLSVVNQHRTADKLSTHMIGIMFGCWNARGQSAEAEQLHNAVSELNCYIMEVKKKNKP